MQQYATGSVSLEPGGMAGWAAAETTDGGTWMHSGLREPPSPPSPAARARMLPRSISTPPSSTPLSLGAVCTGFAPGNLATGWGDPRMAASPATRSGSGKNRVGPLGGGSPSRTGARRRRRAIAAVTGDRGGGPPEGLQHGTVSAPVSLSVLRDGVQQSMELSLEEVQVVRDATCSEVAWLRSALPGGR